MDALEIATLKDNILRYLLKHPTDIIDYDTIKKDLKLYEIPDGVLKAYISEMDDDEVLNGVFLNNNILLNMNDKGERLLIEGGYSQPIQDKFNEIREQEVDRKKAREKTILEIENLKWTKWVSIIALIISIVAIIVSIFNKYQ
jgi:hypothetical protein